jgi:alanine racemase
MTLRPIQRSVSIDAIERNFQECVRLAGPERYVIPAIKADAYGHGCLDVAQVLEPYRPFAFWTGHVLEALKLRRAGIHTPIILFGGYLPESIPELWDYDLIPTIYDDAGIASAARAVVGSPMPVYVKVDCGLGRLGVAIDNARAFLRAVAEIPTLRLAGVYTHLPFKDTAGRDWALSRSQSFVNLIDELKSDDIEPDVTQLWGSSGLLAGLPDSTRAVCIGHALYGLSPLTQEVVSQGTFEVAFRSIVGQLIQVAEHAPEPGGAAISEYRTTNSARTGVVAFGYGDGVRRPAPGETITALVNGRRVPVLGVSLEHMVLDLSCEVSASVGDRVVLLGTAGQERITLSDWAQWLGCSVPEVVIALGRGAKFFRDQSQVMADEMTSE